MPVLNFFSRHKKLKWFVLILAILFALFLISSFFFPPSDEQTVSPIGAKITDCQRKFNPQLSDEPYYRGPLFDAHFHLPVPPGVHSFFISQATLGEGKDVTLNQILCLFDKENTRGAIAFYIPKATNKVTLPQVKEIKQYSDRMNLFLSPVTISADDVEKILSENPRLFKGIGEINFYEITNVIRPIDSNWAQKIYKSAAKHHLPIMMHPGTNQRDKLEKVLAENPEVVFLLHGYEIKDDIKILMGKYPNLYYSIDSATLYALRGNFVRAPRDKFIQEFKENFSSLLNEDVNFWRETIEKYPDRFMWGTDRGAKWHYDDQLSSLMEEFARAFIGRLDSAVQENFAYKNAEAFIKMFKAP